MNNVETIHSAAAQKPVRVVVADDEKRIADTLVLILQMNGFEAEAGYDGAAALALCSANPPDLLLSDVVMPVMNGIELGLAVRERFPGCPVLLFSGQAATADMLDEARKRGHEFALLAKPVHPTQLLEKINELLRSRTADAPRAA